MSDYYIKYVWGPYAQGGYPDKDLVHFAERQKRACQRFKECKGFLLYETGSREGNKTGTKAIYAQGVVDSDQPKFIKPEYSRGVRFPYAVKIKLQKRVDPKDGIFLKKIRKITGVKNIQRRGGILEITEAQYKDLSDCLYK